MTQTNAIEPLVGDITFGAFSNPLLKRVLHRFGQTAFARSSACMEFEAFLIRCLGNTDDPESEYHLLCGEEVGERLREAKRSTCLEIGTYHGISAVVLSQYFERVVCVSVDHRPRKLMKRNIVDFLGITNIEFHDVNTNAEKAAIVNALDFDFCYSDGDHVNDTRSDFELVKRCGRVLFHEYWCLMPPCWNLVNSLPQEEIIRATYDCFAYWEKKT